MIKTYLDSGVLIAAARGTDIVSSKAILILDDDQRQFCCSCFVRLEILAKAKYHQQQNEVEFYQSFFSSCRFWADPLDPIVKLAEDLATKYGLNALDALQIASAIYLNADEFITTEKTTKPLHRVTKIKVISITN
ncbi:MAG TPA: nucleic acid-binding protein [Cyanothece sp. UBA12306]|nr:nucleic acid-binding protein [Cyanothece sp. UBA12306]